MAGQSLVKNYIHIVFTTKNRVPMIFPPVEEKLHSYIATICKNQDCPALKVGGFTNHIHILCLLSKKITIMKLLEEIKKNSSKWIKTQGRGYENFYWQDGYGAFSVYPADLEVVKRYIANQHEHHGIQTFEQEYRAFLDKHMIEYDERYIWG